MAETGKKMGDYTPLESNKKEYFLGEGEAGVVAVGKTEAGGTKTNRLVKLSDIAGDKLPSGGTEGQVLTKTSGGAAWAAVPSELPSGGTTGQVLTKTSNGEAWADAPKELPTSGSSGQFLKKTANGVEYASVNEVPSGGTTGQVLTKTASGETWADAPKELPATTLSDAGKALHVGSDGVPVFKFAELRQMPDVVQESASDNGHLFTNNTYTKLILKYNLEQDLYSPGVKLAADELLNCIIDIYIDSTYSLDGHELFIMFDVQRDGGSLKQIARPLTGDHFRHLEKGSYIRIHALGDSWSAQVGIPWNTPGWLPCQLVPAAEVGDTGKMLQVLDRDGTLGWGVGIPAPANGDVGKVLTASTSEGHLVATWESASGGGGGSSSPYTRATATFGDPSWMEPNYFKQSITIQNNTYTVGSGIIPYPEGFGHDGYKTKRLDVNLTADFPMAILKLENLELELQEIHVFNGSTELRQLYPIAVKLDEPNYYYDGNEYASYAHSNFGQANIVEIHILGDTYTILSSVGATDGLS